MAGDPAAEDPDAERQAHIADPDLGGNVGRLVTAFVGDSGRPELGLHCRGRRAPGAQTDAFYRGLAGLVRRERVRAAPVASRATRRCEIAGRTVDQATCAGGVRTYHVRISGGGLLVSISDLGDAKFGEQVIAGLRP